MAGGPRWHEPVFVSIAVEPSRSCFLGADPANPGPEPVDCAGRSHAASVSIRPPVTCSSPEAQTNPCLPICSALRVGQPGAAPPRSKCAQGARSIGTPSGQNWSIARLAAISTVGPRAREADLHGVPGRYGHVGRDRNDRPGLGGCGSDVQVSGRCRSRRRAWQTRLPGFIDCHVHSFAPDGEAPVSV